MKQAGAGTGARSFDLVISPESKRLHVESSVCCSLGPEPFAKCLSRKNRLQSHR
jgi:hypothetical protein